jgi:hypothetical protein
VLPSWLLDKKGRANAISSVGQYLSRLGDGEVALIDFYVGKPKDAVAMLHLNFRRPLVCARIVQNTSMPVQCNVVDLVGADVAGK